MCLFFFPRFFRGGRLSQPLLCVFVLLFGWLVLCFLFGFVCLWVCFVLFFPHWLLESVFVYAGVYLGKLLWSYRSEVRVQLRRETYFKCSDSDLFYSFTFNLFSFMCTFANGIFATWLHS